MCVPVVPIQPLADYYLVTPDSLMGTLNGTRSSPPSFHLPRCIYITAEHLFKFDLEGERILTLQIGLAYFL